MALTHPTTTPTETVTPTIQIAKKCIYGIMRTVIGIKAEHIIQVKSLHFGLLLFLVIIIILPLLMTRLT